MHGAIKMKIIIKNSSPDPIYKQISDQLRGLMITGELKAGDALPSIRNLAKELRISVITTKRSYEDLEREGFLETVGGKGTFVAHQNMNRPITNRTRLPRI
jgi:GntR family transcriptional regulator